MLFIDGDTLFFFNYRSDRMREIVSLFGMPDKPIDVKIPKDLVCDLIFSPIIFSHGCVEHHDDVALQRRVPIHGGLPSSGHDERPCRVACERGR